MTDIQASYKIYLEWSRGNKTQPLSIEGYEKEYAFFDSVYSILVQMAQANEIRRGDFILRIYHQPIILALNGGSLVLLVLVESIGQGPIRLTAIPKMKMTSVET